VKAPDNDAAPVLVDASPMDAGADTGGSCGNIPTIATGCFDAGHHVCPDGTCVDFVEAGCGNTNGFNGTFPFECESNANCDNGFCCAGQSWGMELAAWGSDECAVDAGDFYSRGTTCSPTKCKTPVCARDSDCPTGKHCAVMHTSDDPKSPAIGACIQ